MEKYIHNGVEVTFQVADIGEFLKLLNSNGIIPSELPILDEKVYKYFVDGQKKYAIVVGVADECERIYITTEVPEDSWGDLVHDVEGQRRKEKPASLKTRAEIVLREALKKASERADKECGELGLHEDPSAEEEKHIDEWYSSYYFWIREELSNYGYSKDSFNSIQDGIKEDLLKKIYE